jgi:phage terminase large subunit
VTEVIIPKAFKGLFEPYRYKAAFGGRGSAKSHSFATALVLMAVQRPMRIVCAREIQNSLRESVKQLIEDKIKACGLAAKFDCQDKVTIGANGSRFIYMGMWRNPEAVKSLEGADVFWGEEASAFSERSLRLIRPTMRKPGSELWFSWNPEFEDDPIDKFFRGSQGAPPDTLLMPVGWQDNPFFKDTPLQAEMELDYRNDPAKAANVWGGDYVTAIEGAYFAKQLIEARAEGRIGIEPADPYQQKRAFWDIGTRDHTAIWIAQFVGRKVVVIDYYEASGQPLEAHLNWIRERHGKGVLCVLPHDGANVNHVTANRFSDHVKSAGFDVQVVKNQGKGAAMMRVEALRALFPRIYFHEETTRDGLKALATYHEKRGKNGQRLGPEHDEASHGADAAGLMAIAYKEPAGPRLHVPSAPRWRADAVGGY